MRITIIQPAYHMGDIPDERIAEFLIEELRTAEGELIVLPEYSNAGGLSDIEAELNALSRAELMLIEASKAAKKKRAYVAINVLEERRGQIKNSTYLFDKDGRAAFIYNKQHLPPSEIKLGVVAGEPDGKCACTCVLDGIRFAFMTCYDVYFNEQIEYIAKFKPDIIIVPGYQRGERVDIIDAQAKLLAFRTNSFVARSSYSMGTEEHGGSSMLVAPDGKILKNMRAQVGSFTYDIDPTQKYMRPAGFGQGLVRGDDFITNGLCPEAFN
ncbi:MAG: carbon-nitrogen hydrolase family protein [Clostridia bacterium]|nr:carbon-nitrogen hydrolase family protein [Clostridia bacterium]